ncbi:GRF1-interacting factor 3-like isoform X1 [Herrania umbratica]|uniref:GRF1-interacting factor 3-like isoform X1 n=1 Tax=Herrania umbratica TaxID=108875 RepID=A0A6J1BNK7_9ROSI|nr:GRF1-interacting factor 3-like isoform X1 [Herrania umbratica]
MQQTPQLMNITTEQIQKYLDENKQLIMAILENQNQGKFAENASFQAQLQQNLMYLAKIADAQPQAPTTSSQMPPQSAVQQEQSVQSAQAVMAKQHPGFLSPKLPFHLNDQQQQPQQLMYLQQQQLNQPQMGLRSAGSSGTYQGVQSGLSNNFMNIQGIKQDSSEDGADEGIQNSAYGHNATDTESMRLK